MREMCGRYQGRDEGLVRETDKCEEVEMKYEACVRKGESK